MEPEAVAAVEPARKRASGRAPKAAPERSDATEADADATPGDEPAAAEPAEPADAPDALDETAAGASAGADTESDSTVPGDDA